MNIGIDIDDTIAKTTEEVEIYAKNYIEKDLKRKFQKNEDGVLNPMWASAVYGRNKEEDEKFWEMYYEEIMRNLQPKENAVETINKLHKNNKIIIITARWDKENNIIEQITKKWLEENKIEYDKIFLGHEDKRAIIKENNVDIFIDDSFKTCKLVSEMNVKTLMMDSERNQQMEDDKIERVFTWKEIEQKCIQK